MHWCRKKFGKSCILLAKNWNKCFPGKNPFKSRGKSGLNTQTGRQTITSLVPHHESGTSRCHITSLVPDYQYVSAASTLSSDYRDQLFVLHTGCQNCCKLFCLGELGSAAESCSTRSPAQPLWLQQQTSEGAAGTGDGLLRSLLLWNGLGAWRARMVTVWPEQKAWWHSHDFLMMRLATLAACRPGKAGREWSYNQSWTLASRWLVRTQLRDQRWQISDCVHNSSWGFGAVPTSAGP